MNQSEQAFTLLDLKSELSAALEVLSFSKMTDTQAACLPAILKGNDVAVQAQTGSGKTLAFSLGLLSRVELENREHQALIMCPTRELAEQVAEQVRNVGKRLANLKVAELVGGIPIGPQIKSLKFGAQVVVGTPGRIMDHIGKKTIHLKSINCLVLDEADRMLDMGFEDEMKIVLRELSHSETTRNKQTLLFSATYPDKIQQITNKYQRNAQFIKVQSETLNLDIEQLAYRVNDEHRSQASAAVLTHYQKASNIIFCRTKVDTKQLVDDLLDLGFAVAGLHGDLEQPERSQVLARFAAKTLTVLVATDVAARGLDIQGVDLVLNHRVSEDLDTHTHRIGRTGRAGQSGLAVTLIDEKEEDKLDEIAAKTDATIKKHHAQSLRFHANRIVEPEFICIGVDGGKRDKLRPGDLLGALTKDANLPGEDIGKISIAARKSYIAIKLRSVKKAMALFRESKIKGKRFKARKF